jgi:hypothetical protein
MRRVAVWIALASLAAAGIARGDGLPVLGIDDGSTGVVAPSGEERYVTVPAGTDTVVERIGTVDATVGGSSLLAGALTIPAVAYDGSAGGLSGDGRTLVLIEPRVSFPRRRTGLAVLDSRSLAVRSRITLRGDFSFDAVSPHGSLLYLIQYTSPVDPTRYLVRAYDVPGGRLLAKPVVDPTEPDEKMRGNPVSRATSTGGRWAYTLYDGGGGTPFLHALDTARRTARCIDLDALEHSSVTALRLRLDPGGRTVSVLRRGARVLSIDTRTFAVREPAADPARSGSSIPWPGALAGVAAGLAAAGATLTVALRRRA